MPSPGRVAAPADRRLVDLQGLSPAPLGSQDGGKRVRGCRPRACRPGETDGPASQALRAEQRVRAQLAGRRRCEQGGGFVAITRSGQVPGTACHGVGLAGQRGSGAAVQGGDDLRDRGIEDSLADDVVPEPDDTGARRQQAGLDAVPERLGDRAVVCRRHRRH